MDLKLTKEEAEMLLEDLNKIETLDEKFYICAFIRPELRDKFQQFKPLITEKEYLGEGNSWWKRVKITDEDYESVMKSKFDFIIILKKYLSRGHLSIEEIEEDIRNHRKKFLDRINVITQEIMGSSYTIKYIDKSDYILKYIE